jgi:hypothetical protein
MAIQIATAPALGLEIVRQTLPLPNFQLVALGAEGAPAANVQPQQEVKAPYPIYTATIDGLAGGGLSSAQLTAWQYVIESGGVVESTAEVAVADFNADPEVALDYASEQPASYAQALLAAVDDANARPESAAAAGDFELRILRVPSLYILAIWLQRAGEDVLRLVRGSRAGLVAGRWVTETEFLQAIRPLAEIRQLATDR